MPPGPGYGPQGWAGGPGGPPSGKKSSPLVPILVVLALVAAGVGGYLVLSGDDEGGGGSGPAAAAERYTQAFIDSDCDAMADFVSLEGLSPEEFRATCEMIVGGSGEMVPQDARDEFPTELLGSSVDSEEDATATVTVEYRTRAGNEDSEALEMVKEDGTWLITMESTGFSATELPDAGDDPDDSTGDPSDDTGSGDSGSTAGEPTPPPVDDPEAVDDPALADYAQGCYEGDMAACDELWVNTDAGGALETYAETCGGRLPEGEAPGVCQARFPAGSDA